jgi:hypothetical protein
MGDQAASLIVILHALQTFSNPVPASVAIANPLYRFSVFSQWYRSSDDDGKTFEQRVAMALGNENPVLENITPFQMSTPMHRITAGFNKLPILKAGEYDLTISIRIQGETQWSQPVGTYPLNITEVPKVQPTIQ